jgi:hypothetical protein
MSAERQEKTVSCKIRRRNRQVRRDGPPQRKLGSVRPGKIDKVDTVSLISDIAAGVPIAIACRAVGIDAKTFDNWLDSRPDFALRLAQEKRRVIREALTAIRSGTKDSEFRGLAWWLERVYHDHFAPPQSGIPFGLQQNNNFVITVEKAREIEEMTKELLPGINARLGLTNGGPPADGEART